MRRGRRDIPWWQLGAGAHSVVAVLIASRSRSRSRGVVVDVEVRQMSRGLSYQLTQRHVTASVWGLPLSALLSYSHIYTTTTSTASAYTASTTSRPSTPAIMGDAMCGPSNPLQNFQKHTSVDRTLQQDRLTSRQSPAQVCTDSLVLYIQLTYPGLPISECPGRRAGSRVRRF